MTIKIGAFLGKAGRFLSSPIPTLIKTIWYLITHPWGLGGMIIFFSVLSKVYDSTLEFSFEPIAIYIGSIVLNSGNTISSNLIILNEGISLWGSFICWLGIFSAIYMFGLLLYTLCKIFKIIIGEMASPIIIGSLAFGTVLLLTSLYTILVYGSLAPYFGLKGFYDLFTYLIIHKDFVEGLINQTSYGGGGIENNISILK